jgi:hypothetical protein
MIPFDDLVARWKQVSNVPIYVGTIPEGTATPYVSLNALQSNPVRSTSNSISYTESMLQLIGVADKLVDSQYLGNQCLQAFDKYSNAITVLDMVYMNQAFEYGSRPNLSGNRPWSSIQEFRLRS